MVCDSASALALLQPWSYHTGMYNEGGSSDINSNSIYSGGQQLQQRLHLQQL